MTHPPEIHARRALMAVSRSCRSDSRSVRLEASAGEYLEYRIPAADPNVAYVLTTSAGAVLFKHDDCPPGCVYRWPPQGVDQGAGEVRTTLGLQFFGDESLQYEVDRKSADDQVLDVLKRCWFRNDGGADDFFDLLRVFVS